MDKSKGILIFATGHILYGHCAVRLAASLKANEPALSITLVADGNAKIFAEKCGLFDAIIEPKKKQITYKGKRVDIRAKIFADQLSPYDETLMLDADMLWLPGKSPNDIFEQLANIDFSVQNTGFADLSKDDVDNQIHYYWAKVSYVKSAYGFETGKFYQMTGEFLYFKKTDAVLEWFKQVRLIYDNCKVEAVMFANQTCTDELAYSIASVITGLYPHKDNWLPVYWPYRNKQTLKLCGVDALNLRDKYYAISAGGNQLPGNYSEQYEMLAKGYICKMKIDAPYKLERKKYALKERRLQ